METITVDKYKIYILHLLYHRGTLVTLHSYIWLSIIDLGVT